MRNWSNRLVHRRTHRAIAGIVTTGIVLAAVSIMGVMMMGWSQTSIVQQKLELEETFNTQINKINEDLLFENVWFATPAGLMTKNHLNVTMGNIGILGLNVTEIQVTNTTASNNTSFIYYYADGGIEKSNSLSVNATYQWQSGDELQILVFTDRGNQFITHEVVP